MGVAAPPPGATLRVRHGRATTGSAMPAGMAVGRVALPLRAALRAQMEGAVVMRAAVGIFGMWTRGGMGVVPVV